MEENLIPKEKMGALDYLASKMNSAKDTLSAIEEIEKFEEVLKKEKENKNKDKAYQSDLLKGIKRDMER